jgi:hypothetical protein
MAGEVGFLFVNHVGDANGYVSLYRAGTDRIALTGEGIHYRAATGELIREDPPLGAVASVNEFLTGLHLQHFRHWLLRFLYFFGGLAGCACIATGFLFFVDKRRARHAAEGAGGARLVEALAIGTVTGTVLATLAMLVANRVLPAELPGRDAWQQSVFWTAWLVAGVHAFWRGRRAWHEQCLAVAALALLAPLLNWLTTGDHLLATLGSRYWPVAGVDLALLAVSVTAFAVARRLPRRAMAVSRLAPA